MIIKDFVNEFKLLNASYILFDDVGLNIYSNIQEGLMEKYLSKSNVILDAATEEKRHYKIFIIDINYIDIDKKIKDLCNYNSRSKHIQSGYYNLHHFGTNVCFFENSNEFYILGHCKDCAKVFWSFLIKYIISLECIRKGMLHFKGTGIEINGNGYLIIGPKGSGKSTFISKCISNDKSIKYLSNTHCILTKDLVVYGVNSRINFRKDMLLKLKAEYSFLNDIEIKSCMNVDPVDLGYNVISSMKLKGIIAYTYNSLNRFVMKEISADDLAQFIRLFAEAVGVYGLHNDLYDCFDKMFIEYCKFQNKLIENMVSKIDRYYVSTDSQDVSTILKFLNKIKELS